MTALELVVVAVDDRIDGIRGLTLARSDRGPLPPYTLAVTSSSSAAP